MDRIDDSVTENMLELALASAFIYKPKVALAVKEEFASLKEFFDLSGRELLSIKGVTPDFVNVSPKNFLRTKERYVDGVS